jgi:hypothetical protein
MFISKDTIKKTLNTNKHTKKVVYKFSKNQVAKCCLIIYIKAYNMWL